MGCCCASSEVVKYDPRNPNSRPASSRNPNSTGDTQNPLAQMAANKANKSGGQGSAPKGKIDMAKSKSMGGTNINRNQSMNPNAMSKSKTMRGAKDKDAPIIIMDDPTLPNKIFFIDFEKFKRKGFFPRFPDDYDMCTMLSLINKEEALMVFISQTWQRGWVGAVGYDGKPHPDNKNNDQYNLCVEGIERAKNFYAPGMSKCFVWFDYGQVILFTDYNH